MYISIHLSNHPPIHLRSSLTIKMLHAHHACYMSSKTHPVVNDHPPKTHGLLLIFFFPTLFILQTFPLVNPNILVGSLSFQARHKPI